MTITDTGYAATRWEFDDEVTRVFDDMLERSIPHYRQMREAVFAIACELRQPDTLILDLGCSRGEALAPLVERYGKENRYIGVEISEPMIEAARLRFKNVIAAEDVEILPLDLRNDYPRVKPHLTLAILSMMFVPIERRLNLLRQIYEHTAEGGALIIVEKVLGAEAVIDDLMVRVYHDYKRQHGYSDEAIERKRLALEGVLVPVTASWNVDMIRQVGFGRVECFWRWMNFAGWVAIKDGT